MVSTEDSESSNPGSNPGRSILKKNFCLLFNFCVCYFFFFVFFVVFFYLVVVNEPIGTYVKLISILKE